MHVGAHETGNQIPRPIGLGIWRTVRTSPSDNKPQHFSLNHHYNMTFSISPRECQYIPLEIRIWCSKREPFHVLLPLLRLVVPLNARDAALVSRYQFLTQDITFSIHLSDNRFTACPLLTAVVSAPTKWAPWVDISSPQPASARFFAKCLCFVHSVIEQLAFNWCRWERRQMTLKNSCRTVTKDILTFRWLGPLACHIALSGPLKLWDPLMIYQSMIPGNDPIDPGPLTHRDKTQSAQCWHQIRPIMFKTANRPYLVWNLSVTLSRYPF